MTTTPPPTPPTLPPYRHSHTPPGQADTTTADHLATTLRAFGPTLGPLTATDPTFVATQQALHLQNTANDVAARQKLRRAILETILIELGYAPDAPTLKDMNKLARALEKRLNDTYYLTTRHTPNTY